MSDLSEKMHFSGSSSDGVSHEGALAEDGEKTMMGQTPFPLEQPQKQPIPLHRLDSRLPTSNSKTEEDEQQKQADDSEQKDPFAHLPFHEADILKRQVDIPPVKVTYFMLYRYATRNDIIIMVVSSICAIAGGAAMPLMTIIFGSLTGKFTGFEQGTTSPSQFQGTVDHLVLYFVYLAIGMFCTIYVSTVGFIYTGEHIAGKIRQAYLAAILRQNIAYFDKLGAGEITTRITADTNLVQDGMSQKVALCMTAVATFVTAYVIAYIKYWKLALIDTSAIVAIVLTMGSLGRFITKYSKKSLASYAEGGTVAEEVISSIRNATAFGTQEKLAAQYDAHLIEAEKWAFKMKAILGSMIGFLMFYVYLTYSLTFWLGSRYLVKGEVTVSDIITILLSIMIGAFSLGNVAPHIQAFTTATAAASKIFATIDRKSPLDPDAVDGLKLEQLEGTVELRNIRHIYPSRPEVVVMEDVNLVVPAGKTTALVGASGSGKSTIVGLVERFYDPVGGQVLLDGHDVQELNLRWLRQQVSLVSQEPTLFATTVFENILHGLIGTDFEGRSHDENRELVEHAARMANAHDFITQLPEGYETNVGERGFLMSGGQKQRIAIARAIVSDPRILLLDEATSALDTKSEGVVQAALDKAAQGRTTIVIAHRLSTIKHADNIVVMSQGQIVEQGKHDALLEQRGPYYNLVEAQRIAQETERVREEAEDADDSDISFKDKEESVLYVARTKSRDKAMHYEDPADLELGRTKTGKSESSKVLGDRSSQDAQKYNLWTLIRTVGSFNKSEWKIMLVGLLAAIIAGAGNPVQSVFFAKSITALGLDSGNPRQLQSQIDFWSWMYFMLACVQLLSLCAVGVLFAYCSEKLIHRARDRSFRTMLRQDISFFDDDSNTAGALTSFLSTETTHLAGISGATLGTLLQVLTTLVVGFTIALAIGWKLALVCIATVPIVLFTGFTRFWILARFQERAKKVYEKSASYACEATSAIRTVASLTREGDVWQHYHKQITDQEAKSLRQVVRTSTLYAASQSLMFCCTALGFWYGATLLASHEYSVFQFFLCFSAVIFGSQSAGTIFAFAPDMGKAKHAASSMRTLFDRTPAIDTWSREGEDVPTMEGAIEFRDVHFRYPTRPEQPVLRGLDLTVKPGQYVALVGASGCGKSTTIAMMERFYDPLVGSVYVDGKEITTMNINSYRRHLALVSQEPTLYQGTIKENILLGADTKPEDVPDEAIVRACKDANIYDFILSLPDGFNTVVGSKGSMLSGGQKQRVAIARALLRDPKILLLDEATSALDSESEKVVQAALDAAAKGRTTIAVAHRLSTIQKADAIYVFEQGRIVERGTHSELMHKGGVYFELVNLQSLGKTA
ncbi:multidrug resistance protein 1, 2, 3 [Neohortaea acidophila]|uniref:Multidrug resistance protein 1, 2, 3 n=1 Tax=Neohortaea acidophila TaxID=245834 RepID=A0A6A6PX86_9PEZI|nr:multidrug resistance protein 1, 2, 3 [Neohortaea acidophila]KAF2484720.1 multidrug resistance protein 1, 2, 3 [Neohortaea acidophila]